jgi:tetratricopeptide (TPR) repeat protein
MPMYQQHPDSEELEHFLQNTSRSADSAKKDFLVRHLLAECTTCREHLHERGWSDSRLERLLSLPSSDEMVSPPLETTYDYSQAFSSSDRKLEEFLASDRPLERPLEDLLSELQAYPENEQRRQVAGESRFAQPQLVRWLIEGSFAARYEDADRMLHLAELAQTLAEACPAEALGSERRLADLRARAWGQLANALRVNGRLSDAEESMASADRYRALGTGDPPLRARLLEQTASLQMFQRHFEKAIDLADEAGRIYRDLGDTHQLASTLVQKAIACLYSGEAERAAPLLNQAIPLIDQEEDPHLLLAACHNLVRCYIDLDRHEQGLELYFKVKELYKEFKDSLILLRAAWQEGELLRGLGHPRAAETALLRARRGFMERGLTYEVAVVSLDLAAVYVKLGATEEVKQTVSETMPIFRALRVGREALASLIQLQQVADQEIQALALIQNLTHRLEYLSTRRQLE